MTPTRRDPNLLDLRQIVADQRAQATERQRTRSSWRTPSTRSRSKLSRPPRQPRDWAQFRRELLKFGVVLLVVGAVAGGGVWLTTLVQANTSATDEAKLGADQLQQGFSALGQAQGTTATTAFTAAEQHFTTALQKAQSVPSIAEHVPVVGDDLIGSKRLLTDARQIATALAALSAILPAQGTPAPAVTIADDGLVHGSIGLVPQLAEHHDVFVTNVQSIVTAMNDATSIPLRQVPGSIRDQVELWQHLASGLFGDTATLEQLTKVLLDVVAADQPKDYLVIFQNNDELRATGGFTGTFLLVEFYRGTFKILDAPGNGPYALSDIVAAKNLPPQPVQSIASIWTFHDANWYLDVPTSAQQLLDMYKQDRGFLPEGVLFFSPQVMEDLLRVTGPLRPDGFSLDITAENFVPITEEQVEFNYDKAKNNPKEFLIDLVPTMVKRLASLQPSQALQAAAVTLKNGVQNNLLLYSNTDQTQTAITKLGWDGSVIKNDHDYLAVVDTNLGGGKTDRNIDERVAVVVNSVNGQLRHTVTVTRTHNGSKDDKLDKSINRDFLRLYAPSNAQLVSISGQTPPDPTWFKATTAKQIEPPLLQSTEGQVFVDDANGIRVTHESGKFVMGVWSRIAPGESQTIVFTYDTPVTSATTWTLDWQHQPGAAPARTWSVVYQAADAQSVVAASGPGASVKGRQVNFSTDSTLNRTFSVDLKSR